MSWMQMICPVDRTNRGIIVGDIPRQHMVDTHIEMSPQHLFALRLPQKAVQARENDTWDNFELHPNLDLQFIDCW